VTYRITWSKQAEKHFHKLDKSVRERVSATIDDLAGNPRPSGMELVVSMPGVVRVRKGGYRILYRVDGDNREIWIEDVRKRSEAYGGH
jgi:mRNA interferase RelE/StbE